MSRIALVVGEADANQVKLYLGDEHDLEVVRCTAEAYAQIAAFWTAYDGPSARGELSVDHAVIELEELPIYEASLPIHATNTLGVNAFDVVTIIFAKDAYGQLDDPVLYVATHRPTDVSAYFPLVENVFVSEPSGLRIA